MIAISASRDEADIAGAVPALGDVGLTIRSFIASNATSMALAAEEHDPAPFDRCLSRLVVAKGTDAVVTVKGDDLCISATPERLEELASCFFFPAHATDGQHFHFELLPGDPNYFEQSLGLVVSVSRSGA